MFIDAEVLMENFVVVATYSSQLEAEIAQAALAEAEIESFLKFDDTGGMLPPLQLAAGVKLLVEKADEPDARTILSDQTGNETGLQ
ncbi:MAG TPA: DUF2007 domain-containing protein [Bacteroidota bacterium]|nr:DUF2007 domain-containing protein [Bacteroidota bacterium]